jgi:hypothetical protein
VIWCGVNFSINDENRYGMLKVVEPRFSLGVNATRASAIPVRPGSRVMSIDTQSQTIAAKAPKKLWWLYLLVLGPITGALLGIFVASLRGHRPFLAAGCVVALAAFWIGAPALVTAGLSSLPAVVRH